MYNDDDVVKDDTQSDFTLLAVPLDDQRARSLEADYLVDMAARYGGGPGPVHPDGFEPPGGCFLVAVLDGRPVGCGGFRAHLPGIAEIKRMYVDPSSRGRGIARKILAFLEERARAAAYTEMWLETGSAQPEAIALYQSAGYEPMVPYGEFKHDERSRCFSRRL
jgi:GNAT superfamily N-acetyltransferase